MGRRVRTCLMRSVLYRLPRNSLKNTHQEQRLMHAKVHLACIRWVCIPDATPRTEKGLGNSCPTLCCTDNHRGPMPHPGPSCTYLAIHIVASSFYFGKQANTFKVKNAVLSGAHDSE